MELDELTERDVLRLIAESGRKLHGMDSLRFGGRAYLAARDGEACVEAVLRSLLAEREAEALEYLADFCGLPRDAAAFLWKERPEMFMGVVEMRRADGGLGIDEALALVGAAYEGRFGGHDLFLLPA